MRAAAFVGVVADEHIAGAHLLDGMPLEDVRQDADEAAEMHGNVLGLAQRVAAGVEQRGGAVAPFLDVGRVAGAHQRLAHFFGDRRQRTADDLDGDGVERGMRSLPNGLAHPALLCAPRDETLA